MSIIKFKLSDFRYKTSKPGKRGIINKYFDKKGIMKHLESSLPAGFTKLFWKVRKDEIGPLGDIQNKKGLYVIYTY